MMDKLELPQELRHAVTMVQAARAIVDAASPVLTRDNSRLLHAYERALGAALVDYIEKLQAYSDAVDKDQS